MCFEGTGHTIGPPCTRKEFDAAVKAAAFAALPQADRLPTIGGWRVSDRSGVFWFSTLQADESERVPGAVRARVESSNTVRWFCPDEAREHEIRSAGWQKAPTMDLAAVRIVRLDGYPHRPSVAAPLRERP